MRVRVLAAVLGLAAAFVALGGEPAARPAGKTLRVLSYNIHHGEGTDGKLDLARIAGVIKAAEPDLVAVQEVDRNTTRTNKVDQAAELARLTGLHGEFAKAIDFQGGEYGQAILSRFPIKSVKTHTLPGKKGQETRIAVEAPGRAGRRAAAADVRRHPLPARRPGDPRGAGGEGQRAVRPGGRPGRPGRRPERDAGQQADEAARGEVGVRHRRRTRGCSPSRRSAPRRQIDYVLYRPAGRFRVVEAKVIDETVASDHRPVLAVLEWAAE